jgi:lysozyme
MAKRGSNRWRLRLFGALLLLALVGAIWGWWHLSHWRPDPGAYRVQGAEIDSDDGAIDWTALKSVGADFVYLDASASAFARDTAFTRNLEEARAAKLLAGAVHRFDPCQPAERQAANFVSVVPRDAGLLPPAVELDLLADDCPIAIKDTAVLSELMTFLNQVETHTGKAALLKLSERFEDRYHIAVAIDRNVWLTRTRFAPDYAGRPWALWTANSALATEAADAPLRWVVVQP